MNNYKNVFELKEAHKDF